MQLSRLSENWSFPLFDRDCYGVERRAGWRAELLVCARAPSFGSEGLDARKDITLGGPRTVHVLLESSVCTSPRRESLRAPELLYFQEWVIVHGRCIACSGNRATGDADMKTSSIRCGRAFGTVLVICASVQVAAAQSATARIVDAADSFLSSLSEEQRQSVLYSFDDEEQRVRWSNLPIRMYARGGLSMGELSADQRRAAMTLLSSVLSPRGYQKIQEIVEADEVLKISEGNSMFGEDLYYMSLVGPPSENQPWLLQFGGHHLALNVTIAGERGVLTPSLTGAQPALYTVGGVTVRPLGDESDMAFALLEALDSDERDEAILDYVVADLVLGPGQDGKTIQPEGLKASNMNERQRRLLLDVIAEWTGIVHESSAAARMEEIEADLDETWFAWSGLTTVEAGQNVTAYYRIQGPRLVIEYAPQNLGGDRSLHIHTIYRDPTNDYGRRLLEK